MFTQMMLNLHYCLLLHFPNFQKDILRTQKIILQKRVATRLLYKCLNSRFPVTKSSSIGNLSVTNARGIPSISYLLLSAVMRII